MKKNDQDRKVVREQVHPASELMMKADSRQREMLETVTKNIGAGLVIISKDYKTVWANEVIRNIFGDVEGKVCYKTYNQRDEICPGCGVREVFERGSDAVVHEQAGLDREGNSIWSEIIASPIRDADGNIRSAYEIVIPITEKKRVEEALHESEEKYRSLLEGAADAIVTADQDGHIINWNRQAEVMFGYSREEIIGKHITVLVPEELRDEAMSVLQGARESGLVRGFETERRHKDGTTFPVEINISIIKDPEGRVIATSGIVRDISDRKKAEAEIRNNNIMLNTLFHSIPDPVYVKDCEGRYLFVNKGFETVMKKRADDVLGKKSSEILPGGIAEESHRSDMDVLRKGEAYRSEQHMHRGDDEIIFDTIKIPMTDDKGDIIGLVGVSRDITERKQVEETLKQGEEYIRNIINTVDEGFLVIDREYRILTVNQSYCDSIGTNCDAIIGRHCYEISHHSDRPCFENNEDCAVRTTFDTGKPASVVHRHVDREGNIVYVETKAFPLERDDGGVTKVIETISNITETFLLEEQQLKTQKLEAIGTLAGGIAHDFNNLLQGVFGYLSLARADLIPGERAYTMLNQAEKALTVATNLTSQLLTFSKGGSPVKRRLDIRPVIENAVKFSLSGSCVDYSLGIDEDLWLVEADEGQLSQVIQNIVINAAEAMPSGGTVAITTGNVENDIPAYLDSGKYIEIVVCDSGSGIAEQDLSKIFDPYFSTKEKGSGLGLATAYSIVKKHGGGLDVISERNKGSAFYIYLPALEGDFEEEDIPVSPVTGARKGRILLMDDEEIVREVTSNMLTSLGFNVDLAAHGEDAIRKFDDAVASGRPYDVVLLDLTVKGGMGGDKALRKLIEIDPDVKVILSSGYSDDDAIAAYQTSGSRNFLQKPYTLELLCNKIDELLA